MDKKTRQMRRVYLAGLFERFPDAPRRTLAKRAFAERADLFRDLENARSAIRVMTGQSGNARRADCNPEFFDRPRKPGEWLIAPSLAEVRKTYRITGSHKTLVISDIHMPFQDTKALKAALNYGEEQGCDICLINGDLADFYDISYFMKDPRLRDFDREINAVRSFLVQLVDVFPRVVYKIGNHEERWESFLFSKCPELAKLSFMQFRKVLDLDALNIDTIDRVNYIKLGDLTIIHGHELQKGLTNPVNPARGACLRAQDPCLLGHYHRTSKHSERTLTDRKLAWWSIGCLCGLNPYYTPNNKWNHGGAIVETNAKGGYKVDLFEIINGRIY